MPGAIKYIVNDEGEKTSVFVPIEMWKTITEKNKKMTRKLEILNSIHSGLKEVFEAKKKGKKLETLKEFLS